MPWPEGRQTIEYLLRKGRLERIDSGSVDEACEGNLDRSEQKLATARRVLEDGDSGSAYSLAYTSYRMAAEALLARQALRSTGGEGGHRNVEAAVAAQFKDAVPALAQPTFERLRGTRHSVEYFEPGRPSVTDQDASWALDKATEALAGARSLIHAGGLDIYD
jgi:hypothetical protein